ncbi:MAG: RidA family protein, partial [Gemmatimonadetes bacterium]|nr:RidA family protein [Gemmatimonadota bacterium]
MSNTVYPMPGPVAREGTFAGPVAFSNAVRAGRGNLLFVSGQLAFDDDMNIVGAGDMRAQTRQVLLNIGKALTAGGATFDDVVRVQVFVTDLSDFRAIHEVRLEFFDRCRLPASTLVRVAGLAHEDAM